MKNTIKTNLFFKVIDDKDKQLHSTWHVTAFVRDEANHNDVGAAKMEVAGFLTQDANDHLDNVAIQEDLEENGYTVAHVNEIPQGAEVIEVHY